MAISRDRPGPTPWLRKDQTVADFVEVWERAANDPAAYNISIAYAAYLNTCAAQLRTLIDVACAVGLCPCDPLDIYPRDTGDAGNNDEHKKGG